MLGRIMPGSQSVVAHIETGQAVYHAPDTRLPSIILEYCAEITALTGINTFVIDREVNSKRGARAFSERGWGLLSMLDKNEYTGLSDWDTEYVGKLEDGSEVYSGRWSLEKKNKTKDPRIFVLVVKDEKLLPFWGTPAIAEKVPYIDWPGLYSERTEIQENGFRRMKEHGALTVNYGAKKIESDYRRLMGVRLRNLLINWKGLIRESPRKPKISRNRKRRFGNLKRKAMVRSLRKGEIDWP